MIKSATLLRYTHHEDSSLYDLLKNDKLAQLKFVPTDPSTATSWGFVPPEKTAYNVYCCKAQDPHAYVMCVTVETKKVPKQYLKKEIEKELLKNTVFSTSGKKKQKEMLQEMQENKYKELLARAFPQQKEVMLWLDEINKVVVIGSTSKSHVEIVRMLLARLEIDTTDFDCQISTGDWLTSMVRDNKKARTGSFSASEKWRCDVESKTAKIKYAVDTMAEGFDRQKAIEDTQEKIHSNMSITALMMKSHDDGCEFVVQGAKLKSIDLTNIKKSNEASDWDGNMFIAINTLRHITEDMVRDRGGWLATDLFDQVQETEEGSEK